MDHQAAAERLEGARARKEIADEEHALTLGVELAETGQLVGDVVLFFRSVEHRSGEIGWVFILPIPASVTPPRPRTPCCTWLLTSLVFTRDRQG